MTAYSSDEPMIKLTIALEAFRVCDNYSHYELRNASFWLGSLKQWTDCRKAVRIKVLKL
jgi:hypothetical protein